MSYDPETYWPARYARQGRTTVARGGRADEFDAEREEFTHALERVLSPVGTLLDYGCGPGRFAPLLSYYADSYVGFDIVPEARAMNPAPTTDTLSRCCDLGVAIQVFQHMPDDREIHNIGWFADRWVVIDHEWLDEPDEHMHPRTPEQVAHLLGRELERVIYGVRRHWLGVFS